MKRKHRKGSSALIIALKELHGVLPTWILSPSRRSIGRSSLRVEPSLLERVAPYIYMGIAVTLGSCFIFVIFLLAIIQPDPPCYCSERSVVPKARKMVFESRMKVLNSIPISPRVSL